MGLFGRKKDALGSSQHPTTPAKQTITVTTTPSIPSTPPSAQVIDEKAKLEMEYLNIINSLSKEKQESREEMMKRQKETEHLSDSNKNLMSQVSDLQAKLEQMAKDAAEARERPESYDSNGSKPPTTPKASSRRGQVVNMQEGVGLGEAFVFDENTETQRTVELERLKAKLKEHQDNNAEISNRIKRIREKHAQRRADASDSSTSDTSSISTLGTARSGTSLVSSPLSSPRQHLVEVKRLERNFIKELQRNDKLKQSLKEVEIEKESIQAKLDELTNSMDKKLDEKQKEVDQLRLKLDEAQTAMNQTEKAVAGLQSNANTSDSKDKEIADLVQKIGEQSILIATLQNDINTKEEAIQKTKNGKKENYNSNVVQLQNDLKMKNEELDAMRKEKATIQSNLKTLETDFNTIQKRHTETIQQMEEYKLKYENESKKNKELQANDKASKSDVPTENEQKLKSQVEGLQLEIQSLKQEVQNKKEELETIKEAKDQSLNRLEEDMITMQMKSSKTFDELEDLKVKYEQEVVEKKTLQDQVDQFSPEEILVQAKKESENELKKRDREISTLKKELTNANVSKTEIELKLMEVMNDMVTSQSTKDTLKTELQDKLDFENAKATKLEILITNKEKDVDRMRDELNELRSQIEKESDSRRSEITSLNGEVVQKSSLLSDREREVIKLKSDMEDMKLRHDTEIAELRREIDEFSANRAEVERVHFRNAALEEEISNLKHEIRRLHMKESANDQSNTFHSSMRVIRDRNDELKHQVEKLQRKMRRMKKNVTRIEL